ncbi:hypothetical protein BBO_07087 [Beauveria brongniartii RCEF 3172]|uniref:Uncharacterized protein n=1 Tax=Beauveria brongniartii RCEF 3172 TaxID=1081107 RepID=A0A167A197_9HYPO|nr:hypothetical protein BBO_07087 [Beauveria brongniartii RCEF 3172]
MKYTTLAAAAATTGLVTAVGAYRQSGSETAWTPATQTQPPVAGFTLRPTPALRMPRAGLLIREDDDDDDDDDDDGPGRITHGSVTATSTPSGSSSGSVTSAPRPSNTCGWDKNGGCCSGNNCRNIPKQCVERNKECDSDDNGGTLCCRHSSAPACYTWLISTSTAGRQETYSMLGCTDKPGTGTLLPTDPASAGSSSSSSSGGGGGGGGGGGKSNTGAIVGGVIGGILALLLVLFFIWYVLRQRRRRGKAAHVVADGSLRDSALSHGSWAGEHDNRRGGGGGVEKSYEAVPKRKPVPGSETQDSGYAATTSPATTTTTTTMTDRGSPNEHLAYSVSSASGTMGSQGATGVVSSLSTAAAAPPPPLAGVVEAPDTGVPPDSAAPVEVAGTTVTRETMQNRAELP